MKTVAFAITGLALTAPISASGAVTFYDIFYSEFFEQTSDDAPTSSTAGQFSARIFANAGDVTAATLTSPSSQSYDMTPSGTAPQGDVTSYYDSLSDLPAVQSKYPSGTYTFTVTSGAMSRQSATLDVPSSFLPNEVPYLTGGSYSSLQGAPGGVDVPVTWNSFSAPASVTTQNIFFDVFDVDDPSPSRVYSGSGANGTYLGDTIPGSVLVNGHSYAYDLYYDPRVERANAGFGSATGIVAYDRATIGTFDTAPVPEPATIVALAPAALLLRRRRAKTTV